MIVYLWSIYVAIRFRIFYQPHEICCMALIYSISLQSWSTFELNNTLKVTADSSCRWWPIKFQSCLFFTFNSSISESHGYQHSNKPHSFNHGALIEEISNFPLADAAWREMLFENGSMMKLLRCYLCMFIILCDAAHSGGYECGKVNYSTYFSELQQFSLHFFPVL